MAIRLIYLLNIILISLALHAQDVNIKGKIENAESEYVYFSHLRPQDGQCCFSCMDSVLLDDKGCFCYTMNTDSVALVRMWYSQSMRPVTFFAGKDDMEITLDTKRAFDFKLKGGKTYEEQQIYRQYMRGNDSVEFSVRKKELQLEAAYDSISKRAKWLKTGITLESMFEIGAYAWLPQRKDMMLTFISQHPDFTISALIAMQILDTSPSDYKWINEILGNTCELPYYLSASVKHAKEVTDCLNNPIGSVAPDFEKRTLTGDYVRLKDMKGKYVLLYFWPSLFVPDTDEIDKLKQINTVYKKDKLEILGVVNDHNSNQLKEWGSKYNIPGKIFAGIEWNNAYCCDVNVIGDMYLSDGKIPRYFLINDKGIIVNTWKYISNDMLENLNCIIHAFPR